MRWAVVFLFPLLAMAFSCPERARPFRAADYELAFQAFVQGGHLEAALKTAHAALCQGKDGLWRRRAAQVARWLGKVRTALEHLVALAEEGDWGAWEEALEIARRLPDYPTLYRLLLKHPREPETIAELARTAILLGRYREAASWLWEGYRKRHDRKWLWQLVEMGYFLDWTEEERQALERLVLEHGDLEAVARLAKFYLWRGEIVRAYGILRPHAEALLARGDPLPLELGWRLGKMEEIDRWLARFPSLSPLWTERWVLLAGRDRRFERAFEVWQRTRAPRWFRFLLSLTPDRERLEELFRSLTPKVARALAEDPLFSLAHARLAFFRKRREEAWSWLRKALLSGDRKVVVQALWLWIEHASRRELLWLRPFVLELPDDGPLFQLKVFFLIQLEEPFLALDLIERRLRSVPRLTSPGARARARESQKADIALTVSLIDLLHATDQVELANGWRAYLMARFGPELSPFEVALFELALTPETLLERLPKLLALASREDRWGDLLLSLAARIGSPSLMRLLRQRLYRIKDRPLPSWNVSFALSELDHEALFREITGDDLPYRDRISALEALGWTEQALQTARSSFDRNGRDKRLYRQLHRLSWREGRKLFGDFLLQTGQAVSWRRLRVGIDGPIWPGQRLSLLFRRDWSTTPLGGETLSSEVELRFRSRRSPRTALEIGLFQSLEPVPFTGIALGGRYRSRRWRLEGEGWWQRRAGWEISLELAQKGKSSGVELQISSDRIASGGEWHLRGRLERFRHRSRDETLGSLGLVSTTYARRLTGTPLRLFGTVTWRDFFGVRRKWESLFFAEGMQLTMVMVAERSLTMEDIPLGRFRLHLEGSWIEELGWGGSVWLTYRPPALVARDRLELQLGYFLNQGARQTKEGVFHLGLSWSWLF